jgi:hypothetical protein
VDRRLVLEAAVVVSSVRIGLWSVPFVRLRQMLASRARPAQYRDAQTPASNVAGRVALAISAVARNLPGSTTCLAKALATQTMLRRRGIVSELRIGVRNGSDERRLLDAHAWVECGELVVMGALDDLSDYRVLAAPGRFS